MTNSSTNEYAHAIQNGHTDGMHLSRFHREEILTGSAIDPQVARERGYVTIERPNENVTPNSRTRMVAMGFPSWATKETYFYPGLHIPGWTVSGGRYAGQWKPFRGVANRSGKTMRYASAKGAASRLDVHPRWTIGAGDMVVPPIRDASVPLWITEGVKKADSLTSRGVCTIALAGVFNWRGQHGTLGDWEDVALKGREVTICFDADTNSKPQVANAMARLGKWLKSKGVSKVNYSVVPAEVVREDGVTLVKGVDDYFAAGGTLIDLERGITKNAPRVVSTEDTFTDARLAEALTDEVLDGSYLWAAGVDWLQWTGRVWQEVHEVIVIEAVRQWAVQHFAEAAQRLAANESDAAALVEGWRGMLSSSRATAVLRYTRGIIARNAEELDADPDILNTPEGVVNLMTGEVMSHHPDYLCTKITSGSYRKGCTHPDWERAVDVLPQDIQEWFANRVGQAITGHTTADGVVPIMKGGGENGKGLLMTDGLMPAFGSYAAPASPKLFASAKNEHSTERADLRGQRLVIAEELTEGRSIDVTALKQIADVGRIKARRTHKDNMEFDSSHSIFATTNYTPVIAETDHGTWRRLALVVFPYTFLKPGVPITDPEWQRRGDPTLKARIKSGKGGQHDAAVTWAVDGALRWYASTEAIETAVGEGKEPPAGALTLPARVADDTDAWRAEADRILGFWRECLDVDPECSVLQTEMVAVFNEWLKSNGHSAWAKETFVPRFIDHAETKSRRVTQKRPRLRTYDRQVARPPIGWHVLTSGKSVPAQPVLFEGVRYREMDPGL